MEFTSQAPLSSRPRRATTGQMNQLFRADSSRSSPHFVHIQQNGQNDVDSLTFKPPSPPQRRNSFLGSLFSPKSNGHTTPLNGMREMSPKNRQRSISTASPRPVSGISLNSTVSELRPSTAREAALETFAVVAKKRICVVRKFGSHMDTHITSLLDGLGRNANTEATYLTVDQQTGAEILNSTQRPGLPLVFIKGDCIGGISELRRLYQNGMLAEALKQHDYDLIVLGGGSGGVEAAKEAATLGKKVAVVNFSDGSATATNWNVGRVPKKLMQRAAQIGGILKNAKKIGWKVQDATFDWSTIRDAVGANVADENAKNEADLRAKNVDYINGFGKFSGSHELTIKSVDGEKKLSADRFLIAVGLRARVMADCCIGSDDLFSLKENPGRTLCIGDSIVSLEIAAFLASLGNQVTVLIRGFRIRGFDVDVAERIQRQMIESGIQFLTGVATNFRQESDTVIVSGEQNLTDGSTEEFAAEFQTVVCASGREPRTANLNFSKPGIKTSTSGKILGRHEQSQTAPHVYSVGDILEGATEFSQVSAQAARLLMRRLFVGSMERIDYERVLTSALLPIEFCASGLTERDAIQLYGQPDVQVYDAEMLDGDVFCKAIFLKSENSRLIGFQILAPQAAELASGFAMAMKLNAHLRDFNDLITVHPSAAEAFARLQPCS
ncbi:hypothetical protein M3Y98_00099900 [Aphelenchoides besseyi]|nr:hypothetical protein M3Y98_00099900 [Aphelenchoides besseyi]KAI6198602.1 hypothetical protein M3Y96_00536500 [Aphelenchoides besseyi]